MVTVLLSSINGVAISDCVNNSQVINIWICGKIASFNENFLDLKKEF
jgi:hypothetical protein